MKHPLLTLCTCLLLVGSALGLVYSLSNDSTQTKQQLQHMDAGALRARLHPYHFIITAHGDAKVTRVSVTPGDTVKRGDTLVELDGSPVVAPVDGIIMPPVVPEGIQVGPHMHLCHIADPQRLIVEAVTLREGARQFLHDHLYTIHSGSVTFQARCDCMAAQCATLRPLPPDLDRGDSGRVRLIFVLDDFAATGVTPGLPATIVTPAEK